MLFISGNRPTPRFLIIDQPSQAYYPPAAGTTESSSEISANSDERAVQDMYKFIFRATRELFPNLQVIVTDHAKLGTDNFISAIIEERRDGIRLVPLDWIQNQ